MTGKRTRGPWFVRDFRASEMRRLGWTGPSIDRILITDRDAKGIAESNGENCVIARIQFDNRPDELDEGNLADAHLMAAAPDLYAALLALMDAKDRDAWETAWAVARAALSKARGETP